MFPTARSVALACLLSTMLTIFAAAVKYLNVERPELLHATRSHNGLVVDAYAESTGALICPSTLASTHSLRASRTARGTVGGLALLEEVGDHVTVGAEGELLTETYECPQVGRAALLPSMPWHEDRRGLGRAQSKRNAAKAAAGNVLPLALIPSHHLSCPCMSPQVGPPFCSCINHPCVLQARSWQGAVRGEARQECQAFRPLWDPRNWGDHQCHHGEGAPQARSLHDEADRLLLLRGGTVPVAE